MTIKKRTAIVRRTPLKRSLKPLKRSPIKRSGVALKRTRVKPVSARRKAERPRIEAVRAQVWARSSVCECCGHGEVEHGAPHQMHETYSRAMTRRCSPERRFDSRWCIRVCVECHELMTANKCRVYFTDLHDGANDGILCQFVTDWAWEGADELFTPRQVWMAVTGRAA